MSGMSELYMEIEEQLSCGISTSTVAGNLQVPLSWVLQVQTDLYADSPNLFMPDDEELSLMADYYGA